MNYIVVDLEWNQPYSKQKRYSNGVPVMCEIIQIGAVKLDSKFEIMGKFERNISPVFYKKITRHVKSITGLSSSMLSDCAGFEDVFTSFMRFCGEEDFKFITWGCDDIPVLKNNMEAHGLDSLSLPDNINLQVVFNVEIGHDGRQWSLERAMERLGIEQELIAHDALCDAVNTVKIAKRLCGRKMSDKYSENDFIEYGRTNKIEDGFKSMKEALHNKKLCVIKCPVCNKRLKTSDWVCSQYRKYTVCQCKRHGMFKINLSVKRTDDGYAAIQSVALASPEAVQSYNENIITINT